MADTDPRLSLQDAWDRLEAHGWTIHRINLDKLDTRNVRARLEDAQRHLRVLEEGLAAGWRP